jgi:phasin family protein
MSDTTFDPKTIFEAYRSAFAPALKAQQEGIKAMDRMGRYQYAVAGDYLEWSLAQAKAAVSAQTPVEFVTKQVELTTALSEKLRARAQEFVSLATDTQASVQSSFADAVNEASTKVSEVTRKKAG